MASNIWCSRNCVFAGAAERCSLLDRLGVPNEFVARTAASYFNEQLFHEHLSESIKRDVLDAFSSFILKRNYSDEALVDLFRTRDKIITQPFKELSKKLALESAKAVFSLNQSLDTHILSLSTLETEVLSLFDKDAPKDEIVSLVQASFADVKSSLETNMGKLKNLALFDPTSTLSNRRSFDAFLHETVEKHKLEGQLIGLAMFDIDNFKGFNDVYGHRVGDQVIALVGREMRLMSEREEDDHTRFFPARFGGEEFAVIASGPHAQILPLLAERIRESVCSFNFLIRDAEGNVLQDKVRISVSAGVVLSSVYSPSLDEDSLVEQADKALYAAKNTGKNRVYLCSKSSAVPHILISR